MTQLDALFLHVPRYRGQRREVMVLPMGLPAMVNLLADEGRRVEIWHLGIESEVTRGFSLRAALERAQPSVILLSLHWNQQTRPVIDLAERVKRWRPEAKVVLGGLTASVFAREAAGALPFVDAVVRGDGEEPVRQLLRCWIDDEGTLAQIPNLVRRGSDGAVVEADERWQLGADLAASLRHGDLGRLRHRGAYLERALYADFSRGAEGSEGYRRAAYLNAGRGCAARCVYCGGAAAGQLVSSGRRGVLLYPLEKLVVDVRDAAGAGAEVLRSSFDPTPARPLVRQWLEALEAEGLRLRWIYDLWSLPTPELLEALGRRSAAGSVVVFSPECGSERVRQRVRPPGLSDEELLRSIEAAEAEGLRTHCFFSAGLPGEGPAEVEQTARLIERLRASTAAAVSVAPMYVDPGSPMWLEPARHGVRLLRSRLLDFYNEIGLPGGPGYETEHFDEAAILAACDRLLAAADLPPMDRGDDAPRYTGCDEPHR